MASGRANTPGGDSPDGKKWLTVLVPAVGVAVLVGVVVAMSALSDPNQSGGKDGKGGSTAAGSGAPFSADKLTDGSSPTADDPGLKELEPGLKYRDLTEGTGAEVKPGATVNAHYTGWNAATGRVFDSSRRRGAPTEFSLNQVVEGWKRGIPGMKVGGIRKLVIAPELGYGSQAKGPDLPPNTTMVFEVEILGAK
jgi:peptidylprolyl isomerase